MFITVDNPAQSVDMVLFLNGLPIVTLELKNRWDQANQHDIKDANSSSTIETSESRCLNLGIASNDNGFDSEVRT